MGWKRKAAILNRCSGVMKMKMDQETHKSQAGQQCLCVCWGWECMECALQEQSLLLSEHEMKFG